jgi:transcriptional regulator with XRE-family HTH domain
MNWITERISLHVNFQDLHEQLRIELVRRIDLGSLTGTSLARQVGFKQGHISNYLNRKRSLSLEGLDRVLAAQDLSIDQLMPLDLSASAAGSAADVPALVPVVSFSAALEEAQVRPASVIETIQISAVRLQDNRSRPSSRRGHWQRFVAIRADEEQAAAMDPVITAGAIVVVDRHYNSLAPYRPHHRNLYAVRSGAGLLLRYVEFDNGTLILRPLATGFPVQLVSPAGHESPGDYLAGRVCLVISEL